MAGELGKVHLPTKQLEETLSKLTVPELQQKLKKRGLKKSGVKAKLIQRLAEAIRAEHAEEEDTNDSLNKDESSGQLNDASLEESAEFADSSANESAPFHDPYTEFESSIPGVVDLQKSETISESSTKDVDDANNTRQSDNLTKVAEPTTYGEEHYGTELPETLPPSEVIEGYGLDRVLPEDQEPVNQYPEEKDPMVLGSGNVEDVLEGTVDKENREDLNVYSEDAFTMGEKEEDHVTTENEEPEYQSNVQRENEDHHETKEECQNTEDEVQIEDRTSSNEVDEEISTETVKSNTNEDEQMETKENIDKSDDLEAHHDDHEEDMIEIDLQRSEKDDFPSQEIEPEEQSDLSVKHEIKLGKKKLTAPVHLKKRRNVTEDSDPKQDNPVPRKRRWGSSRSNESLTISSESLKGLIPEVSVIPTPNEDPLGFGLDYGEMEEGEIDDVVEADTQLEDASESKEADLADVSEEGSFRKEVRRGRIVRISMKDTVKLQRVESNEEEEEEETKKENEKDTELEVTIPEEKVSLLPEISSEDPDYVRERSPSPPKNEPSRILSIRNLVRPFTVRQLREFLSKVGTMVEDEFWIDRIKSHCYVTYETVDDAVASRSVIHGTRWPAANPKLLSADFAVNSEMYKETEGKLGTPPSPIRNEEQKPKNDKNEEWQRKRERNAEQEKRKHDKEQSRDKEQRAEVPAKPKEKKDAPGKLLDDLFRKTKALPCIYWLPLTKEQVVTKEKEREKRREDRLKLNEEANIRENKDQEDSRKQREIQNERREKERESPRGRSDERIDRKFPVQYRNRRRSKSP